MIDEGYGPGLHSEKPLLIPQGCARPSLNPGPCPDSSPTNAGSHSKCTSNFESMAFRRTMGVKATCAPKLGSRINTYLDAYASLHFRMLRTKMACQKI